MCRSRVAVAATMGTASIWIDAVPKEDVGAVVLGNDRLRIVVRVFSYYRRRTIGSIISLVEVVQIVLQMDTLKSILWTDPRTASFGTVRMGC